MKRAIAASALALGMIGLAPSASADPGCEWRSATHIAEHGGRVADSAWHVSRGELPNCSPPEKDEKRKDRDEHWGRDEFGFHCTWRGCG